MTPARSRPRAASGGGLSPQVIALSVLAVIIAAVAAIFFMQGEKPAPPTEEPQVENPFEGLPPETPPAPKK